MIAENDGNRYAAICSGVYPDLLPGIGPLADDKIIHKWNTAWNTSLSKVKGLPYNELTGNIPENGINALLVSGDIPANKKLSKLQFCIQLNMFITKITQHANVILPVSSFLEIEGHTLDLNWRPLKLRKVIPAPGKTKSISEIIYILANAMNENGFAGGKAADIWKEMLKMNLFSNGTGKTGPGKLIPLKALHLKRTAPALFICSDIASP